MSVTIDGDDGNGLVFAYLDGEVLDRLHFVELPEVGGELVVGVGHQLLAHELQSLEGVALAKDAVANGIEVPGVIAVTG